MTDFKSLIQDNALADIHKKERIERESKKLRDRVKTFLDSLDNDMLLAISMYGNDDYKNPEDATSMLRFFKYYSGVNALRISCGTKTKNGKPSFVMILVGQYGLLRIDGLQDRLIAAAVDPRDNKYIIKDTGATHWINTNYLPDKDHNVDWLFGSFAWKIPDPRCSGDNRSWFEICNDTLPGFAKALEEYLKKRAAETK